MASGRTNPRLHSLSNSRKKKQSVDAAEAALFGADSEGHFGQKGYTYGYDKITRKPYRHPVGKPKQKEDGEVQKPSADAKATDAAVGVWPDGDKYTLAITVEEIEGEKVVKTTAAKVKRGKNKAHKYFGKITRACVATNLR